MCAILKTHKGRMVDLLRDFDFDHQGRIYISEQAVRDMGALFGMATAERVSELQERLAEAEAAQERLQAEVDELERFKEQTSAVFAAIRPDTERAAA